MSKPILTVNTTDAETFSKLSGDEQRWLRKRRLWQAEWTAKDLPTGDLILRLRARAKESLNRANAFLVLLFLSVVVGLGYFVGLPLWQDYQRAVQDTEAARAEADLMARETALQEEIASFRENMGSGITGTLSFGRGVGNLPQSASDPQALTPPINDGTFSVTTQMLWFVGDGGAIWQSPDDDISRLRPNFQKKGNANFNGVATTKAGRVWVVGDDGLIGEADTTGPPSQLPSVGDAKNLSAVRPAGLGPAQLKSSNSWTDADLNGVAFANEKTGWAVGSAGVILSTVDGGGTWTVQPSGTEAGLHRIAVADAQTAWAVGSGGTILRTTDGGSSWKDQSSGTQANLNDVSFSNERTGWVVGDSGTILGTTNGGATWTMRSSGTGADLNGVAFADERTGWVVGDLEEDSATMLRTQDGGLTWTKYLQRWEVDLNLVVFKNTWVALAAGVGSNGDIVVLQLGSRVGSALRKATSLSEMRSILIDAGEADPGYNPSGELNYLADLVVEENALAAERRSLRPVGTARSDQEAALVSAITLAESSSPEDLEEAIRILEAAPDFAASSQKWWSDYAEQLPAGVLLLFLLATLGSLYRYNTRIAGFYHARADALELMALETPPDQEQFEALAGTLAADRVEFKAAKTPADMATEITKEVIGKLNLKPGA